MRPVTHKLFKTEKRREGRNSVEALRLRDVEKANRHNHENNDSKTDPLIIHTGGPLLLLFLRRFILARLGGGASS